MGKIKKRLVIMLPKKQKVEVHVGELLLLEYSDIGLLDVLTSGPV